MSAQVIYRYTLHFCRCVSLISLIIGQFLVNRQLCWCSAANILLTSIVPSNRGYIDTEMRLRPLNGERWVKVKFPMAAKHGTFYFRINPVLINIFNIDWSDQKPRAGLSWVCHAIGNNSL